MQLPVDVRENYKALSSPMVSETYHRVTQLIKALHHDNHIDTNDREMAFTHAKPATNSDFLHSYKDSQTKSFRAVKALQNEYHLF